MNIPSGATHIDSLGDYYKLENSKWLSCSKFGKKWIDVFDLGCSIKYTLFLKRPYFSGYGYTSRIKPIQGLPNEYN